MGTTQLSIALSYVIFTVAVMVVSLREIMFLPTLQIPSPNVAEGHQLKNASLMADVAGSRVITEDELDSTTLGTAIEEILGISNSFLMLEIVLKVLLVCKYFMKITANINILY